MGEAEGLLSVFMHGLPCPNKLPYLASQGPQEPLKRPKWPGLAFWGEAQMGGQSYKSRGFTHGSFVMLGLLLLGAKSAPSEDRTYLLQVTERKRSYSSLQVIFQLPYSLAHSFAL